MKGIRQLIAIMIIAVASSCSSTHNAASTPQDDVYYSRGDAPEPPSPAPAVSHPSPSNPNSQNSYDQSQSSQGSQQQDNSQDYYRPHDTTSTGTQNQNANTINNYYNSDHYDYSNSAKLRRYYDPMSGYGYYDPYYTNSYYYDNNPASYGSSIYLGYNFWGPSVSIGIGFGWGYPSYGYPYYPSYSYGYPYYGYPYYPYYGYPYYGYGYGNPYCGYYNPYYYNSYDANSSYHYGPRSSISSTGRSTTPPRSLGERYEQAVNDGRISSATQVASTRGGTSGIPPVRKSIKSNPSAQVSSTRDAGSAGGTTRGSVKSATPEATSGMGGGTPVRTNGIISEKNQSGIPTRNASAADGGTRVSTNGGSTRESGIPTSRNHLQQAFTNPQPERNAGPSAQRASADKGGDIRPSNNVNITGSQHLPSRSSAQPANNSVQGLGQNNGGTVRPNQRVPQGNNSWNQRGNVFNRNQNSGNSNPRSNDRPRMYQHQQPGIDQRQSSPQPHQQPSFSQPGRGSAPSGGGNPGGGGGGRSGGSSGSGHSGGGRK